MTGLSFLGSVHLTCPWITHRYLLSYDPVALHSYLETIIASNSTAQGQAKQLQSPWLYLDAANTLFQSAKRRVYTKKPKARPRPTDTTDEADWEALREMENEAAGTAGTGAIRQQATEGSSSSTRGQWPEGVEPILEELPKWGLLGQVLEEIESHIAYEPVDSGE